MSKYALLEAHLRKFGGRDVPMTFAEIEEVIGNQLPSSAFKHRPWWSNNPSNSVITHAWLRAGYVSAEVDMAGFRLVFRKSNAVNSHTDAEEFDFSRIYGALEGTVTIRPGIDLTEPVDVEWDSAR